MNNNLKTQICDALAAWIRQRPGLEFGNYGNVTSFRAEARSIARDKRDAETLLVAVRHNDSTTAEMLLEASKHSYSGRLEIQTDVLTQIREKTANGLKVSEEKRVRIEYCTGQYWPTEYRKAAAAVLSGALWAAARDDENGLSSIKGDNAKLSAGDYLRKHFRQEFGSKMQKRWFD